MKKLALAVMAVCFAAGAAFAESPIKLSLYDQIAWPTPSQTNVVLGIIDSNTPTVHGIDWNFISARNEELRGWQASWIYARTNDGIGLQGALYAKAGTFLGVQGGLLGRSESFTGVQWGFINWTEADMLGVQWGAVNVAQGTAKGVQFGFANYAENFTGLQLGFVNWIENIDQGLQIGLVNVIKNNGWLPAMIFVNGRF